MDEEVIFCHDDIAMTPGPVFHPGFYEKYIFSRYEWIMEPAVRAGKKIVFVSDGNIDAFLERLLDFPIAGIMFENPATPFARVLETWGRPGAASSAASRRGCSPTARRRRCARTPGR
ncbi:MAG: hypothetical protein M5R40_05230 [Anaerolineae bacterium]|nr:hypothetical protein [Anaerolineae bacterium]